MIKLKYQKNMQITPYMAEKLNTVNELFGVETPYFRTNGVHANMDDIVLLSVGSPDIYTQTPERTIKTGLLRVDIYDNIELSDDLGIPEEGQLRVYRSNHHRSSDHNTLDGIIVKETEQESRKRFTVLGRTKEEYAEQDELDTIEAKTTPYIEKTIRSQLAIEYGMEPDEIALDYETGALRSDNVTDLGIGGLGYNGWILSSMPLAVNEISTPGKKYATDMTVHYVSSDRPELNKLLIAQYVDTYEILGRSYSAPITTGTRGFASVASIDTKEHQDIRLALALELSDETDELSRFTFS